MSDPTPVAAVEAPAAVVDAAATAETTAETTTTTTHVEGNGEANGNGDAGTKDEGAEPESPTTTAPGRKGSRAKKDKTSAPAAEPSRRSTRISSQPSKPAKEEDGAGAGRKRSASGAAGKKNGKRGADEVVDGEEHKEEGSNKKAKSDAAEGLKIGDVLPSVTVKNEKGEEVQVATLAVEKGVVLFCVPKADTPGCTTQACGYRDIYAEFTAVDYDIYCVSADSSEAQLKWQNKKTLPYPLLSDPSRTLIAALGAADKGNKTKRSHFVFEKGTGKLIDRKVPVKAGDSPKIALDFIKEHVGGGATAEGDAAAAATEGEGDVVMADATVDAPAVQPGAPPVEAAAPVESAPVGESVA